MTEKGNFALMLKGEQPEWIPIYSMTPVSGRCAPSCIVFPGLLSASITGVGTVKDVFGVTYVEVPDNTKAKVPEPNNFIIDDIRKWRDIIKLPDLSGIDWEKMAKKDLETFRIDPERQYVEMGLHFGYFQYLMAFMGFTNGLCAMYEEPDEVMALFDYICSFFVDVAERYIDYVKPDIFFMSDDIATWKNPFISLDMYREMVKPFAMRQAKVGLDRGLPVSMHCCGRCEDFIADWQDFGVKIWNPAQTSNDLVAVKEKFGNDLIICGGWDGLGHLQSPDVTEEEVRASVREAMDKYAPGGGYCFGGEYLGAFNDPDIIRKNGWIMDEAVKYGSSFYKR